MTFLPIGSGGLGASGVQSLAENLTEVEVPAATWPRRMATGSNADLRRYQHSVSWQLRMDASPEALKPAAMALSLQLGAPIDDAPLTVDVSLDGQLLRSEEVQAVQSVYTLTLDLPESRLSRNSEIEVTLTAHDRATGTCHERPERVAQLLPETVLLPGNSRFDDPLGSIRDLLTSAGTIRVQEQTGMNHIDAQLFSELAAIGLVDVGTPPQPGLVLELGYRHAGASLPQETDGPA